MEYWRGFMSWPIDRNWKCPTCGAGRNMLIWGMIHAQCRCDKCHTEFYMRDFETKEILTTPFCMLREEYKEPARFAFKHYEKPISRLSDGEWDYAFSQCMKGEDE